MIITIASGKGGTGKTTVACNLAKIIKEDVVLLDCDVEEPNDSVFIGKTIIKEEDVHTLIPSVDDALCDNCGKCSEFCNYNAIITLPDKVIVYPDMCHSCGGWIVCPRDAITPVGRNIGKITVFQDGVLELVQGKINVGVVLSPSLIRDVKKYISPNKVNIIDSPPGTSCPVVETIRGSEFVILVTEPTPFGLHDLILSVGLLRMTDTPFGVVINRAGIGDKKVQEYCRDENIQILLEIPNDIEIARVCSRGKLIIDEIPKYRKLFQSLYDTIKEIL